MKLNLNDITKKNALSGKLQIFIPEFYELKSTIENSADGWHNKESVFDHTISVMSALEKIIAENKNVGKYLSEKIGSYSKKTLLITSALLHDIGKKETLVKKGDFTSCSGHEKTSCEKSGVILKNLNISHDGTQRILKIIAHHHEFHKILGLGKDDLEKKYLKIKKDFKDIFPELILLSYADTARSKLKNISPEGYAYRINFYKKNISEIWILKK